MRPPQAPDGYKKKSQMFLHHHEIVSRFASPAELGSMPIFDTHVELNNVAAAALWSC
jgi:hypothetical protein